jgi:hypothetical protein
MLADLLADRLGLTEAETDGLVLADSDGCEPGSSPATTAYGRMPSSKVNFAKA